MTDTTEYPAGPASLSSLQSTEASSSYVEVSGGHEHHSSTGDPKILNAVGNLENAGDSAWHSANSSRSFLPPMSHESQLPTPRSHGTHNEFPFFPAAIGSPESPLSYAHTRTLGGNPGGVSGPRLQQRANPRFEDPRSFFSVQPQTITPSASPIRSSTSLPGHPLSSPPMSSPQERPVIIKTESPPPLLAPAYEISPPKSLVTTQPTPSEAPTVELGLSSPFTEKMRPNTASISSRHKDPSASRPMNVTLPANLVPTEPTVLFSPAHIGERPSSSQATNRPELATIERPRQMHGGELDRIRNQMLSAEDERRAELENRRPEYLKRLDADPSIPSLEEGTGDGVGIMATPAKGRRIQLFDFQHTSAESFEESLMTHGYGTYGEPRTPHRPLVATEGLSQEAMNWLAYSTPAAMSGHSHLGSESEPTEKELKKRKRLEAFKGSIARACAKLYPAEVEGMGRVLLNVPPEEVDEHSGSPAKKRATGKKKRGGAGRTLVGTAPSVTEYSEPRWLDKEIPWCLREKEQEEEAKVRDADRLSWIDKYFAHDTDSDDEKESDKNDDDALQPSWDQEPEEAPNVLKRGRGKAVPLQANPSRPHPVTRSETGRASDAAGSKNLFFPTDPADARTALLSKRSVRLLAQRKLRQNGQRSTLRGMGEGRLACTCGYDDEDDGRPAVQCDDCYNWHHLECIGVHDEAELGEEDDPWFCPACIAQSQAALSASDWRNQRQPTFVPTDDRPVHTSTKNDVAFYSSSPLRDWGSSGSLQTPIQGRERGHGSNSFRRSLWDDPLSGQSPSTPMTAARGVYVQTPGLSRRERGQIDAFDPLISPRSGYPKFGMSTPKNTGSGNLPGGSSFGFQWPPHTSGLFATPTPGGGRLSNSGSAGFGSNLGSEDPMNAQFGQNARGAEAMYAVDDTPIRRAPVKEATVLAAGAAIRPYDSPLAGRGT